MIIGTREMQTRLLEMRTDCTEFWWDVWINQQKSCIHQNICFHKKNDCECIILLNSDFNSFLYERYKVADKILH